MLAIRKERVKQQITLQGVTKRLEFRVYAALKRDRLKAELPTSFTDR